MVGTSQQPSPTISLAVTTLRCSMMSVGRAPMLAKKVTRVKRAKKAMSTCFVAFMLCLMFVVTRANGLVASRRVKGDSVPRGASPCF